MYLFDVLGTRLQLVIKISNKSLDSTVVDKT